MDLSIIVPVYNVEKYVRPCIESIFQQGLEEDRFEVIIVNDGSTDKSMEMIADIIQQHKNITVIHQENLSLSVARNNGIAAAKGEYILMPDSDDMLVENSVPILLEKALETKVDLVVADFLITNEDGTDFVNSQNPSQKRFEMEIKSGKELFLKDLNPLQCYVWRTMYRRDFLVENNITFVPGIYYQDVAYTHECYLKANSCIKTSWLLNIYRKRKQGAATSSFTSQNARSLTIALASTWKLRAMDGLSSETLYKLEENAYDIFRQMVYHTIFSFRKRSERNRIIDNLLVYVPDLKFSHGFKQRLITMMIRKTPHLFINLYSFRYLYR